MSERVKGRQLERFVSRESNFKDGLGRRMSESSIGVKDMGFLFLQT